ncbi:MAG: ATP-binding protein [Candidatus Bathyarchaeia archaeon]
MSLRISKEFFTEFAKKTWQSPYSCVLELVEDSYDEDATRVIVTVTPDYIVIEDDVGMDERGMDLFLTVGSAHKQKELVSPRFGRARTGRYGVGRLSFLAFFSAMKVRTRRGSFHKTFMIDEDVLAQLSSGKAEVKLLSEPSLDRDGSEIWLLNPRSALRPEKILKDLRELPILRSPYFEVYLRIGEFHPWSIEGAIKVEPKNVVGERIPVELDGVTGEITIAYRPLSEEERGITIIHNAHAVAKSLFGFSPAQMSRITGYVRCDWITPVFATKSAIIEDEKYTRFYNIMRSFISQKVLPRAVEVKEGLSYIEYNVFKSIDNVLSSVLESIEREQQTPLQEEVKSQQLITAADESRNSDAAQKVNVPVQDTPGPIVSASLTLPAPHMGKLQMNLSTDTKPGINMETRLKPYIKEPAAAESSITVQPRKTSSASKPRRLPDKVGLIKLGFQVLPYSDPEDEREFFIQGSTIYINRACKAYEKELKRGSEFLKRYALRIIASAIASIRTQQTEALEYANSIIAKALEKI